MQDQINQLEGLVADLMEWKRQRETQQLSYPVDDASRNALGAAFKIGLGSTTKTQVYTDSHGDTLTGPKAYLGTVIFLADGTQYEIPYLA